MLQRGFLIALVIGLSGCPDPKTGIPCEGNADCPDSRCEDGYCVEPAPIIESFTITPGEITVGGDAELTATFRNGTGELAPLGALQSGDTHSLSPQQTTEYKLVVTSPSGATVSETRRLVVHPAPAIVEFKADPTVILAGETAQLSAVFSGGGGSISPDVGTVASGFPVTVKPMATTQYTLTVTNPVGATATAMTTVRLRTVPTPCGDLFVSSDQRVRVCGKAVASAYTTPEPRLADESDLHELSGRVPSSPVVREALTGTDPQNGVTYSLR